MLLYPASYFLHCLPCYRTHFNMVASFVSRHLDKGEKLSSWWRANKGEKLSSWWCFNKGEKLSLSWHFNGYATGVNSWIIYRHPVWSLLERDLWIMKELRTCSWPSWHEKRKVAGLPWHQSVWVCMCLYCVLAQSTGFVVHEVCLVREWASPLHSFCMHIKPAAPHMLS